MGYISMLMPHYHDMVCRPSVRGGGFNSMLQQGNLFIVNIYNYGLIYFTNGYFSWPQSQF